MGARYHVVSVEHCLDGCSHSLLIKEGGARGDLAQLRVSDVEQQWAMLNVDSVPYAWGRGWMGEGRVGDSLAEVIREVGQ